MAVILHYFTEFDSVEANWAYVKVDENRPIVFAT